jgi:SAM-dependent methyltransferase
MMSQISSQMAKYSKQFLLFGGRWLQACPVCKSEDIGLLWQLPQTNLPETAYLFYGDPARRERMRGGAYLKALPTLRTPQTIYRYDICGECGSAFRNPTSDDQAIYRRDQSKVKSFRERGIDAFRNRTAEIAKLLPRQASVLVDAACGAGQSLAVLRETHPHLRLVGLEISEPAVAFMKSMGLESYLADLDLDDLDAMVAPGTADFIIFSESFEHVRGPIDVLKKLVRMLRPGGRLYYSAQFYGPETQLQLRVAEPIYINTEFRTKIPQLVGCRMHDANIIGDKIQDVLEKL